MPKNENKNLTGVDLTDWTYDYTPDKILLGMIKDRIEDLTSHEPENSDELRVHENNAFEVGLIYGHLCRRHKHREAKAEMVAAVLKDGDEIDTPCDICGGILKRNWERLYNHKLGLNICLGCETSPANEALSRLGQRVERSEGELKEFKEALIDMVSQHCYHKEGLTHSFLSANEDALGLLERAGIIERVGEKEIYRFKERDEYGIDRS